MRYRNTHATQNLSMQSANFVFSRLLLQLRDCFPVPIDIAYRKLCLELQEALIPDHADIRHEQVVTGAIMFLADEGFIRHEGYEIIEAGSLQYQFTKMRLTKSGLALMNDAVSAKEARTSNPVEVTVADYLRGNSDIKHLDAVGAVLVRLFAKH